MKIDIEIYCLHDWKKYLKNNKVIITSESKCITQDSFGIQQKGSCFTYIENELNNTICYLCC